NLMSFRCAVDLVGRLYNKSAGILTYFKDLLCKMTAEDTVQMSGKRFFRGAHYIKTVFFLFDTIITGQSAYRVMIV
ncbi:MAG: hypothetical protein II589_09030, partial [Clostridia bacterium]|nr:hypothetical protein [Clostridia bacterium]